ncbi:MAG: COX15/CtaA family protein [Alphaproteobacteria bacterium]
MNDSKSAHDKAVGVWLLVIAGLIAAMVVVGGLTRLTGSGLSITEWHPVTGVAPPLSDADWQAEFAKYQGTPRYELLNRGMGLASFKTIYWWEWTHRLLGRITGAAFLLPFIYFLWRRRIDRALVPRLIVIFLLGAAQGALGWWMVKSGLAPSRVAVSQYRLALHLGLAVALFGFVLWTALEVRGVRRTSAATLASFRPWVIALTVLVFIQILLGALVAGLDAGRAFDTWPTYSGAWIPPGLYDLSPWWLNHFENHALVHFQHRTVGYIIAIFAVWLFFALRGAGADNPVRIAAVHVLAFTVLQVLLGILTVVLGMPLALAAAHQIVALALFGSAVWLVFAFLSPLRLAARGTSLSGRG